jgi:hypothetical protein
MPGEEQVEAGLEDDLVGPAGMRVGEGVARGVELGEEALRDGDVHPAKVLGEGDDLRRCGTGHPKEWFSRLNHDRNVAACVHGCRGGRRTGERHGHHRHDIPHRRPHDWSDRGGNLGSLTPRQVEESRQDLGAVLHREHLCEFGDAGQAESSLPKCGQDLLVRPNQIRGHLPVMGGSL